MRRFFTFLSIFIFCSTSVQASFFDKIKESVSGEEWYCETQGKTMFSRSNKGNIGGAKKGCSCEEIRAFEKKTFGEVDEEALMRDFDCPTPPRK